MAIGRYRSYDFLGDEPFQAFCRKQQDRIAGRAERAVVRVRDRQRERTKALDAGGSYQLTIRGAKPAQIALEETPDDMLRREGMVAYRNAKGTFMSGS